MKVVKNSIKYFFKTDWSKWIIVFLFFISLLSLGAYRDIVDLFTALLRSYSDNSFIAFIFLILAVNTLYLYKTLFYSNNYLIRTNNRFKYLKYTLLTNLIISFIYYLISFLFVLLFALFKIKGGIDLNIIFNYSIPGYLYFLYHYFKVFIILFVILNISRYILLTFKSLTYVAFIFILILFIINFNFPISLDPNAIYKFNILFPYYFFPLNFNSLKVDATYLLGELCILYSFNIILKNYYLYIKKVKFKLLNLKFLKLEYYNFIKDNIKYFILFFIIEAFMILTYSFLTPNNNVMYFSLNLIKAQNDIFIILNKLFSILFIIFIIILNLKYIYGYGKAYLILRTDNKKVLFFVILSIILNILFINLFLLFIGIIISFIRGLNISFNFNTFVNILFLEIYIGLLINFIFYNKYRILCFFSLIFIILFIISFKLQLINILLFAIILLLSVKLLKIQDME